MEGDEQNKPKTSESAEQPSAEKGAEKPAPSAEARGELSKLKEKIEREKKEKEKRREFLKGECAKKRTPETWITNKPDEGMMAGMAKDVISGTVDEKFAKYQPQFEANGIGDAENVGTVKQAVKEIVYDHFIKTGNDQGKTTDFAEQRLEPKINFLFEGLKKIFDAKKHSFEKPADFLADFSRFTSLNFFANGALDAQALKSTFLLDKSDYDFFLKSYGQYLIIGTELTALDAQEKGLGSGTPAEKPAGGTKESSPEPAPQKPPETAPPGTPPPEAPPAPSAETITLQNKVRILIPASPETADEQIRKTVYEQLPADLDPKSRDRAADRLVREAKKLDAQAGETIELDTDGTWRKVDIAAEQTAAATPENAPQAPPSSEGAASETPAPESADKKTFFDNIFEKISKFFEKFMGYFNVILAKMGLAEAEEFANLHDNEKKDAEELKKSAEKAGLNLETLHPLFTDAEQTKKVLKEKNDKGLGWDEYLAKYLAPEESDRLKIKQELKAEEISQMFTTPAQPASSQAPAAQQTAPPASPANAPPSPSA